MRFRFALSQAGIGLKRNLSIVISVIIVTFISLSFVGASILLQMQIVQAKGEWYDKVEVSVYMCPNGQSSSLNCSSEIEASGEEINDVQNIIHSQLSDDVESVYVENKEEVFQEFEKVNPGGVVEGQTLTPDDMQVILRLKLKNPENYQVVSDVLTGRPGVAEVRDQRQLFEPLFKTLNSASALSAGLAVIMLLAAVLLITTTIRLSAQSRRRETEIMRLVGASNSFIMLPFLLEGIISALIGSLLSVSMLLLVVKFFINDWLGSSIHWIRFVNMADVALISPILVGAAVILSALASFATLKRYMKI
ncbi:MAG: permease-like cell division protein FtsX [Bifidobacteriaceae bacterium]|jgi:cell division transport system permease protein|nr:permease-like cell division protein FtsX [Bifidobacteriaceae bacterium]